MGEVLEEKVLIHPRFEREGVCVFKSLRETSKTCSSFDMLQD